MNVDGTACREKGMGRSFQMWTVSRDKKSVTYVHSAGERAKNYSGNRRGEPYTSSDDVAFKSSFMLCESPTGPTVELRPNVHPHGTSAAFS
jgi:hypothetical protein